MKIFVALAALACAAPSVPQEPSRWSDAIPPARFQGTGLAPVVFIAPALIAQACAPVGKPPAGSVVLACTRWVKVNRKNVRIVVMPDPCAFAEFDPYAAILCHENAHLFSGWKHETK